MALELFALSETCVIDPRGKDTFSQVGMGGVVESDNSE